MQIELAGQAIDNAQSASIGAEGPGLLVAAIILLIAFGSLVAMGLPIVTALFGLGIGLAGVTLLANVLDVPDWASSVATMIGLGVGIDYALFIVTRYRSELAARRRRRRRPSPTRDRAPPAAPWCSPASRWSSRCSACS